MNFSEKLQQLLGKAIKDGVNIAKGKTVTGTTSQYNNTTKAYSLITDGDIDKNI